MPTTTELSEAIGTQVLRNCEGLLVLCEVVDTRAAWGRVDFKLAPVSGNGTRWVDSNSCRKVAE